MEYDHPIHIAVVGRRFVIVVEKKVLGWTAYYEHEPSAWQFAATKEAAIGKVIIYLHEHQSSMVELKEQGA